MLKQKILKLNPLAIFYYFCSTIVVVRGIILLSLKFDYTPAIFVRGWHIHHFVFGFLFLILALDESRKRNFPSPLLEIFYGIGLGLMFDEFAFWTMNGSDYWSMSNFFAMVALCIVAGVLCISNHQAYNVSFNSKKLKSPKYSFRRHFALPCVSFVGLLLLFFIVK